MKKNPFLKPYLALLSCLFLTSMLTISCTVPAKLRPIKLQTDKITKTGIQFLKDENYAYAIDCFVKAIEKNPQDAIAHAWLGVVYAKMGRFNDARHELKIASDSGETSVSRLGAGEIFLKFGEPKKALAEFSQSSINTPSAEAYEGIARSAAKIGDRSQALYAYRKAIALENDEKTRKRLQISAANYCISDNDYKTAREFLGNRIFLGAEYSPAKEGIRIVRTIDKWPAAASGIQPNDIIVSFNGKDTVGMQIKEFIGLLNAIELGKVIKTKILRDNRIITIDLLTDFAPLQKSREELPQGNSTDSAKSPKWAEKIILKGVPNFYKVSDNLYRSAQPEEEALSELARMGIRTVINLRSFHGEGKAVEKAGMKYVHLYVKGWHPEEKEVITFLKTTADTNYTPALVHCQHGADRTGVMVAIYRMAVQNWTTDEAVKEMLEGGYGFHPLWQNLINYVKEIDVDEIRKSAGITKN